jgi:5-aminopentanamidase
VITSRYWELGDNRNLRMKVAVYQAPLKANCSVEILALIREQVSWCELNGVEILCCPEAVLGGLADYASWDKHFAINIENGELEARLAVLASHKVTTILGFTEIDRAGRLYNSAVVLHQGAVAGLYRKLHPAINKSVYQAGSEI